MNQFLFAVIPNKTLRRVIVNCQLSIVNMDPKACVPAWSVKIRRCSFPFPVDQDCEFVSALTALTLSADFENSGLIKWFVDLI